MNLNRAVLERTARAGILSVFLLAPSIFAGDVSAVSAPRASMPGVRLVPVPESAAVTLLTLNFGAVLAVAYLFRRRLLNPAK